VKIKGERGVREQWGEERGRERCGRGGRGTVRTRICHGQEKEGRVAEPFNRHCFLLSV